ncbi:MAG: redoxin domain-containing protein [Pirellulaceae bacterium]
MKRFFNLNLNFGLFCAAVLFLSHHTLWPAHGANRAAEAVDVEPLAIGASAPDFDLPGVDDRCVRLDDFAAARVLVVVFTCNHCPTAQAYEDRLVQLYRDFQDRQVAVVAISPNDPQAVRLDELGYSDLNDSLEEMKLRAKEKQFPFPYLYDGEKQEVSRAYGVQATPHVFIFDHERKLRYVGRIDDSEQGNVKSHDARRAIEALLEGRKVPVERTRTFGCSTKWSDKRADAQASLERWDREEVTLDKIDVAGVQNLAQNASKNYRLVNVWATWCIPCLTELPELVTINRMYRGREFELVTISLDNSEKISESLEKLKEKRVAARNYVFDSSDRDALAEALDKHWTGPVPYTVLIAPGGEVVYRRNGPVEPLELKRAIVDHLGRTYK